MTLKEYKQKLIKEQEWRLKTGEINIWACAEKNYYCDRGFSNDLLDNTTEEVLRNE